MTLIIMLTYTTGSGTTTIDNQDNVAIKTTVNAMPTPTVFLVNIDANTIGINDNRSNP